MFSAGSHGEGLEKTSKHTAQNVLDTEEFVVNVVTEPLAKQMDETAFSIPPDESEFDHARLDRADSRRVGPPRVAAAVINMECTLYETFRVHGTQVILGEVVHLHVDESVLTDGAIDMRKVETVGRLGGSYYTRLDFLEWTRQTDPFSS
jgi:flavin reductase (DIM6/NTAB) family NADH-FMN oxidoreductase RutF